MDKLTTSELNRLITQETRKKGNTKSIGHVLPFIFKSFNAKLPAVDTLEKSDTEPLYDSATKTWRMPPATGQTIESSFSLFLNNLNKVLAKRLPGHIPPRYGSDCTPPGQLAQAISIGSPISSYQMRWNCSGTICL
jgi:hypothetical protein